MRFGEQLRSSLIKEYYWHYIAYEDLKDALKTPFETEPTPENPKPNRKSWTEEDEQRFVAMLEGELDKVFMFQRLKSDEIVRRIKGSEQEVNEVLSRKSRSRGQANRQAPYGHQPNPLPEATDDDFLMLEEYLSDIIVDVHDLAKYVQLNYTGFQKIIKKHDKQTQWYLKPVFAARLQAKPFFKDNYDAFVVKLSKLYEVVRTKGNPVEGDAAAGGGQQNFIRETTKYWVHPDNITALKLIILKHLPVLVFNPRKEFDQKDAAITSIYYDNTDTWELYYGRLKKTEGAEAIRLRWYGGMDNDQIFVERKTHREDWTGEKSVKARFPIKEKYVNAFISGHMSVESVFEKVRREGKKSEKQISDWEQLAREVQYRIVTRKLVPATRSFYNRTAFQLPGDARVRISLDTELTLVREDNIGRPRAGDNWRRMDIGIDHPFRQLPAEDVERFPYAILEVKLQTQAGQEPPPWITELTSSHLVEAVPKFSKFIHGTATLFPEQINLLPFWMPQMDVDIRKPATRNFGIERPAQSSHSTSEDALEDDSDYEEMPTQENYRRRITPNGEARSNQDQTITDAAGNSLDIEERIAANAEEDGYPFYDSDEEDDDEGLEEARRIGGFHYGKTLLTWYINAAGRWGLQALQSISPVPSMPSNAAQTSAPVHVQRFRAPPGKKIHIPVRVEPKVYFAAERTFLSWLEFSILLGTIASTLLNFGHDYVALASSFVFTVMACLSLIYSFLLYLWRVDKMRKRRDVKRVYYEKYGPTIIGLGLIGAVMVNVGLKFRQTK